MKQISLIPAHKMDFAKFEPSCVDSVYPMESKKRKAHEGLPLPYLIKPQRRIEICDAFDLYNSYAESSSDIDDESDQDNSVETTPSLELYKDNSYGVENENAKKLHDMDSSDDSLNDDTDEEYVMVEKLESLPNSKPERPGAIQMMELSKDSSVSPLPSNGALQAQSVTVDESNQEEDDDGESSNDDWVVV